MASTDEELLKAAQAGDVGAAERLFERHQRMVYRFGLRMCGNEDEAREVLQETLIAAFKNLPSFRGQAALSTWLYQIARSFCTKARRPQAAAAAKEALPLDSLEAKRLPSEGLEPDELAHARQLGGLLHAAILALPPKAREVVVLRDVQGLSAEEAAQVLGIEVRALKSRLHRARLDLREQLSAILEAGGVAEKGQACPELLEELAGYAGGDIAPSDCARIEAHLSRCPRCSGACDALKKTVALCRQLPEGEVPSPVQAAVRRALRSLAQRP